MTRVLPNEADDVGPLDMLTELLADSEAYADALRATHGLCDRYKDVATASLIEMWIDEPDERVVTGVQTSPGGRNYPSDAWTHGRRPNT
jgi:starvation-inducible DNA-binding protein